MDNESDIEDNVFADNYLHDSNGTPDNKYFQSSSKTSAFKHILNSNDNVQKNSSHFLALISSQSSPVLYNFFTLNSTFYFKDFYYFAVTNFEHFNDTEFKFIFDHMYPDKFQADILNHCIQSSNSLTEFEFNSLRKKDFTNNFVDIYSKQLMIKYALDNFNKLSHEQLNSLWSIVDLSACQYQFLKESIKHHKEIISPLFFKSFVLQKSEALFDYFDFAVSNNWSNSINYFCKNIPQIAYSYLNKIHTINSDNELNFERLFLYYNPSKIESSHLDNHDLNLVFTKIYEHRFNKEHFKDNDLTFINSLGFGLYKFLEIAYSHNPYDVGQFLNLNNRNLFKKLPIDNLWLGRQNVLYTLLDYAEHISVDLQQSFKENILVHFQDTIVADQEFAKDIIHRCSPDSFLFKFIIESPAYQSEDINTFIYSLMDHVVTGQEDSINFANKINSLSLESLNNFEPHLKFSISILKNQYRTSDYPQRDSLLNTIEKTISNITLNKKLQDKLTYNSHHKDKKLKI